MYELLVVYDNTLQPSAEIKNIVGDKSFGSVIFQKKSLKKHFFDFISAYPFIKEDFSFDHYDDLPQMIEQMSSYADEISVVHVYADAAIASKEDLEILLQKARFAKENITVVSGKLSAIIFASVEEYLTFLQHCLVARNTRQIPEFMKFDSMNSSAFLSISNVDNLLQYITKGFDTRYFNSLDGDEYIVTKTSSNKQKIKSEYTYYHLLPETMKMWFVMPFDYREDENTAGYSMERYHITDLAIRWVNGSISLPEFEKILTKVFYFIKNRSAKAIKAEEYARISDELYIEKLGSRIQQIQKSEIYPAISDFIRRGTPFEHLEDILEEYKALYQIVQKKTKFPSVSVIGHGDLCFSNMLYHNETATLKFIDVKGATTEQDLWTNPYYDLAKLSHSVCGKYDFFNSNLYEIKLSADLQFELSIDFDNSEYVNLFKKFLEQNNYDYAAVRLFEASLFLSMIPLHVDYPKKVFGFLLNAVEIMKEVRTCLKKYL